MSTKLLGKKRAISTFKTPYFLTCMTMGVFSLLLSACGENSESEPSMEQEEVVIHLDYSLMESGSMSRAGEDVYSKFYDSYVKSKLLTPKKYTLSFKNKNSYSVKNITSEWGSVEGIRLLEGSYTVNGTSSPQYSGNTLSFAGDSIWMKFNETIDIGKTDTNIVLNAKYDCFLLLFDAQNIESIYAYSHYNTSKRFYPTQTDGIYYIFINSTTASDERVKIDIKRKTGASITLDLQYLRFEMGKYYYFNDVTNTFDIEPMEQGD